MPRHCLTAELVLICLGQGTLSRIIIDFQEFVTNDLLLGGADKSLARTTFRCRRTESIVSLERGVCSCAELLVFVVTEVETKHVRRRARFQQLRDDSCHHVFIFPVRQGAEENSFHSDRNIRRTCTRVCHRQKNGWSSLNGWFFHLRFASSWTIQNNDHPGD